MLNAAMCFKNKCHTLISTENVGIVDVDDTTGVANGNMTGVVDGNRGGVVIGE